MQTDIAPQLRNQRLNNSTDGIAIKRDKNKKYGAEKVSVYSELKFPVCGQLFVFREDGVLLPVKICKHFLPSQNVLPKAAVSYLLKLLGLSRASEGKQVKESEFILTFVLLAFCFGLFVHMCVIGVLLLGLFARLF